MLQMKKIDAFYGDVPALFAIDIEVGAGELVSIIGPNSAGKSTLLKAILGLVRTSGPARESGIFLEGTDLRGMSTEKIIARGIAVVPEGGRVFPEMTVADNLFLGGYTRPERVAENLAQVFETFPRLQERSAQQARTLSGGERQMLCIGRALMSSPKLILLDEPSLGLQPSTVLQIFEIIQQIHRRGVAILLVEQNVNQTLAVTERTYVLEHGRVALEGRSSELIGLEYIKKSYLEI